MCFSGDHDVPLHISESMLSYILFCLLLKQIICPFFFLDGESAFLLIYTLLKIYALAVLLQNVSWWFLLYNFLVTQTVACHVSGGELAWFLICGLLVTWTVACLVLEGELNWFLMCTLLVMQTVPCLISGGELA